MTQFSKTERFGGNRVVTSQVNCAAAPEGQTVIPIGGGWDGALSAASNGGLSVVTSRQVTGGWEVRYQTGTSMSATYNLTTYVYCLYVTA